ncbi:hypothetical protein BGX34_004129 [Mortierella sp. NVP85]|nr:hypothetical protein BGX34_004129 [Mortierella sp. NVP85]
MANLNIFCVIEGQTKSFSVKVPSDGTVDDLKKAIKEENPNTLEKVDAKDLTLWHVEIPDEDKALTKNKACREEAGVLTVDKVVLTEGMDIVGSADGSTYSTQLLSPSSRAIERFFPQQPKAEHIHIIVQYAQSGQTDIHRQPQQGQPMGELLSGFNCGRNLNRRPDYTPQATHEASQKKTFE